MRPIAAAVKAVLLVALMDAVLFGAAGRVDWAGPWLLTALYLPFLLLVLFWAMRHSPGLLEERGRIAPNVKSWDKVVGVIYAVLLIALLLVAALDAGRVRSSSVPSWAQGTGCAVG